MYSYFFMKFKPEPTQKLYPHLTTESVRRITLQLKCSIRSNHSYILFFTATILLENSSFTSRLRFGSFLYRILLLKNIKTGSELEQNKTCGNSLLFSPTEIPVYYNRINAQTVFNITSTVITVIVKKANIKNTQCRVGSGSKGRDPPDLALNEVLSRKLINYKTTYFIRINVFTRNISQLPGAYPPVSAVCASLVRSMSSPLSLSESNMGHIKERITYLL